MHRRRVDSSSLASLGYDPDRHLLEVEFQNGGVYQYLEVPEDEYTSLRRAHSVGRYVNHRIKPRYRCRRVKGPE